jgi:hypothetical protein
MVVMGEGGSGCMGVSLHFIVCICLSSISSIVVGCGHADLAYGCDRGTVLYSFYRLRIWSKGFKVDTGHKFVVSDAFVLTDGFILYR